MLIARAPVRVSFGGGGTDLAAYYQPYGGMVVSAAINKYFYTMISAARPGDGVQIVSSDYHTFYRHDPGQPVFWKAGLELPRAALSHFGVEREYNVFLASEVPPGTGLGSSGSVAVTLVRALSTLCDIPLSRHEIAETAAHIEIEKLGLPVGKQDQYIAAFGGVNVIRFGDDGVTVQPLQASDDTLRQLEERLLLFFTGSTRESSNILHQQKRASEAGRGPVVEALHVIKALAEEMRAMLEAGDVDGFGQLMDEGWQQKKRLAPNVSNTAIDGYYALAREHGAVGGKVTGAGGGGFLMLYCPPGRQADVTQALEGEGLVRMNFVFDYQGATVVLNTLPRANGWYSRPAWFTQATAMAHR
ncbi:MAG: GHMP kinase [Anaerolineae bacterium]